MPASGARTRRKPGLLTRLSIYLPANAPKWAEALAKVQDELNRYVWMAIQNSLPAKHAPTHLGGSDTVVSQRTPSTITLGVVGSPGTPQLGVSAVDHRHPVDLAFDTNPIPETGIKGNPKPPFRTLKQQTDWLNAQVVREYAVRPIIANTYR